MTKMATLSVAVLLIVVVTSESWAQDLNAVQELLTNIRSCELLYQDIEMAFTEEYELIQTDPAEPNSYEQRDRDYQIVRQGQWFRFEMDTDGKLTNGMEIPGDLISAFDGTKTVSVDGNKIANIVNGRREPKFWYPHRMRTPFQPYDGETLGELLGMSEAPSGATYKIESITNEEIDGLSCVRVTRVGRSSARNGRTAEVRVRDDFWLCSERNYLPIRFESVATRYSSTHPRIVGKTLEWREIEPGIWFPWKQQFELLDPKATEAGGPDVVARGVTTFSKVELAPKYDVAFFNDVTIPKETATYEVSEHGKITNSYRKGNNIAAASNKASSWWLVVGGAVVLGAIGALFLWRRRTRNC